MVVNIHSWKFKVTLYLKGTFWKLQDNLYMQSKNSKLRDLHPNPIDLDKFIFGKEFTSSYKYSHKLTKPLVWSFSKIKYCIYSAISRSPL